MSNTPLAHDLALKRTVHAPTELKPIYAWRDVIAAVEITLPPIVLLCPHGEERFDIAEVADTLGKSLTNVLISQGGKGDIHGQEQGLGRPDLPRARWKFDRDVTQAEPAPPDAQLPLRAD